MRCSICRACVVMVCWGGVAGHAFAQGAGPSGAMPPGMAEALAEQERLAYIRSLLDDGAYDEATDAFIEMWEEQEAREAAEELAVPGMRVFLSSGEFRELLSMHEPARERFGVLRDDVLERIMLDAPGGAPNTVVMDLLALNEALHDPASTLAWFDYADRAEDARARQRLGMLVPQLEPTLLVAGRYAALGRLYRDPVRSLRSYPSMLSRLDDFPLDPEELRALRDETEAEFRERAASRYACCLAAGRDAEAAQIVAMVREHLTDDRVSLALVRHALEAGAARAEHVEWLGAVSGGHTAEAAALRARVEAALADGPAIE